MRGRAKGCSESVECANRRCVQAYRGGWLGNRMNVDIGGGLDRF